MRRSSRLGSWQRHGLDCCIIIPSRCGFASRVAAHAHVPSGLRGAALVSLDLSSAAGSDRHCCATFRPARQARSGSCGPTHPRCLSDQAKTKWCARGVSVCSRVAACGSVGLACLIVRSTNGEPYRAWSGSAGWLKPCFFLDQGALVRTLSSSEPDASCSLH